MFVHGIKKKSQVIIKIFGLEHLHLMNHGNPDHIAIQKVGGGGLLKKKFKFLVACLQRH